MFSNSVSNGYKFLSNLYVPPFSCRSRCCLHPLCDGKTHLTTGHRLVFLMVSIDVVLVASPIDYKTQIEQGGTC